MPRPKSDNPTPAELEILQVLWSQGPGTVRQVLDTLNRRRKRAYTSIMTLLNVMVDKGLLRREPQGRAFVYVPRVPQRSMLRRMVGDLLDRAFDGSAHQLVAHALDSTHPSQEELEQIQRIVDAYRSRQEPQS